MGRPCVGTTSTMRRSVSLQPIAGRVKHRSPFLLPRGPCVGDPDHLTQGPVVVCSKAQASRSHALRPWYERGELTQVEVWTSRLEWLRTLDEGDKVLVFGHWRHATGPTHTRLHRAATRRFGRSLSVACQSGCMQTPRLRRYVDEQQRRNSALRRQSVSALST